MVRSLFNSFTSLHELPCLAFVKHFMCKCLCFSGRQIHISYFFFYDTTHRPWNVKNLLWNKTSYSILSLVWCGLSCQQYLKLYFKGNIMLCIYTALSSNFVAVFDDILRTQSYLHFHHRSGKSEILIFPFISSDEQPESDTVALTLIAHFFCKILFTRSNTFAVRVTSSSACVVCDSGTNKTSVCKGSFYVFLYIGLAKPWGSGIKSLSAIFCVSSSLCLFPLLLYCTLTFYRYCWWADFHLCCTLEFIFIISAHKHILFLAILEHPPQTSSVFVTAKFLQTTTSYFRHL